MAVSEPVPKPAPVVTPAGIRQRWQQAARETIQRRLRSRQPTNQKRIMMWLLGLVALCEFLESRMFVFGASQIMTGVEAGPREFAQVQTAYTTGVMLVIVLQQYSAQRLGYRHYLLLSLATFMIGGVGCGLATSVNELTGFRFIQGLGGGALFTSARILINLVFLPTERAQALRYFMPCILAAGMIGPPLAAILVDQGEWRWIFYGPLPLVALCMVGLWRYLPPELGRSGRTVRLHKFPLIMFALAVLCLQWMLTFVRFDFFVHPMRMLWLLVLGVTLLSGFLYWQWRHPEPLLQLRYLNNPVYLTGLALLFLYYFMNGMQNYLFPIFAQQSLKIPLVTVGWITGLSGFAGLVCALLYQGWLGRYWTSKKQVMALGALGMALGAAWLAMLTPQASAAQLWLPLLIKGFMSIFLLLPVAGLTFRELTQADHFAQGNQGKNLMRQIAISAASALSAILLQNGTITYDDTLRAELQPDRDGVQLWLDQATTSLVQQGLTQDQATHGALVWLGSMIRQQAQFVASIHLFEGIAVLGLLVTAFVLIQNKLR